MLHYVALASLFIAFFTTLFLASTSHAAPGINQTLSFQGRLLNSSGGVVPDGHYNLQFKIYQDGAGTAGNNPGGTLKWTETYINNGGNNGILVKNGLFSVNLGSISPFGTSVDWNQDTIWLSMNVAGSASACTTYGTAPCTADGEMLPMKRMTATPFAINSAQLGGKTADNFIQLSQGVQQDTANGAASINLNKTGAGGEFLKLQADGENRLVVDRDGDIEFGNQKNHYLTIATASENEEGNNITIRSGQGGAGAGSNGGGLLLRGGDAGGTNADGGVVAIDGGNGTGTGSAGSIYIGTANNAGVQIGNTDLASGEQTIVIGANANGGGRSNVIVGATENSGGGSTRIQSKDNTVIATDGVDRATFDTEGALTLGNGVSSNTPADFKIQGTASSANGIKGGNLTVQGGGATTGNANGGNLILAGGSGSGSGVSGLVVLNTPTYATVENDTGCYTGGAMVAADCTISSASVNNSAAVIVGFNTSGRTATLPDPTITTAGRVLYISASNGSEEFTLRTNVGAGANVEQSIKMRQNATMTMFWNGNDWTTAGGSGFMTLQEAYDNTQTSTVGDTDLDLYNGLTVRNSSPSTTNDILLQVQNSPTQKLFSVNTGTQELASNGGAEIAGSTAQTFPSDTWGVAGTALVSRYTTPGKFISSGDASVRVSSGAAYSGAYNRLSKALSPNTTYTVSMSVRLESGAFTDFGVLYVGDGSNISSVCQENISISTSEWTRVTCSFETPSAGILPENTIAFGQMGAGSYTFYVDDMSLTQGGGTTGSTASANPNVQIGGNSEDGSPTLFTLDKSTAAPTAANHDALLGSMYYDTTLGKVQCFEAEGWGDCGTPPDTFVTLSPEFAGGVVTGSGTGTMSTDMCSDDLNINDGSSGQPTVCGTKETYNYYQWNTSRSTTQYKVIYVNYQLPQNFKQFIPGTTSVLGRTDNDASTVAYQFYRNDPTDGLVACSVEQPLSNGAQTIWQKGVPSGVADPATCGFEAGDTLVAKIIAGSRGSGANAYISNLSFAHTVK